MKRKPKDLQINSVTLCPTCRSEVKIVGKTTQHYGPVISYEARQRIIQACNDGWANRGVAEIYFKKILGLLGVAGYEDKI